MQRIALLLAVGRNHVDNAVVVFDMIDGFRLGDLRRALVIPDEDPLFGASRSDESLPIGQFFSGAHRRDEARRGIALRHNVSAILTAIEDHAESLVSVIEIVQLSD